MWDTLVDVAVARQLSDVVSNVSIPRKESASSHQSTETARHDNSVEQACYHGINLVLTAASNNQDSKQVYKNTPSIRNLGKDDDLEKACHERLRLLSTAASDYQLHEEVRDSDEGDANILVGNLSTKSRPLSQWKRKRNREKEGNFEQPRRKPKSTGSFLQRRVLPTTRKRKASTWTKPEITACESKLGKGESHVPKVPPPQALAEAPNDRSRAALETWYKRLNDLYQYKQMYGDCNVPQKYELDPPLGVWVNKQRMEMKFRVEGKKSSLTQDKINALRGIGFVWARSKGQKAWDQKYKELVEYKVEFGNCLVPTKYEKMPALGRWVSTQRAQYKVYLEGRESPMTKERVDKLSALGFTWNMLKRLNGNEEGEISD